jgi:membrane-bound hydrogenase subunit beta
MNDAEIIDRIQQGLGGKLAEIANPAPRRFFLKILPPDLVQATALLRDKLGMTHLSTISGVDMGETFEILYHFSTPEADLNLRTEIPKNSPHVPSITAVIPGAILYEREIQEMFGLTVDDIPDKRRLLLSDDWPDGQYPLRKDWKHVRPTEVIPGGQS